jgi:excisionase family DNA binding protein
VNATDLLIPPPDAPAFIGNMPVLADSDVMNVTEAARFLRIGRNQLYDAIGRGLIPHLRIGRTIRLSRTALMRSLAASCGAASTQGS